MNDCTFLIDPKNCVEVVEGATFHFEKEKISFGRFDLIFAQKNHDEKILDEGAIGTWRL